MHCHFKSSFTYMVSVDIMCLPNSTARNWIRPPTLASDIPNSNGTLVTFSIFGKSNYPASTTLMLPQISGHLGLPLWHLHWL